MVLFSNYGNLPTDGQADQSNWVTVDKVIFNQTPTETPLKTPLQHISVIYPIAVMGTVINQIHPKNIPLSPYTYTPPEQLNENYNVSIESTGFHIHGISGLLSLIPLLPTPNTHQTTKGFFTQNYDNDHFKLDVYVPMVSAQYNSTPDNLVRVSFDSINAIGTYDDKHIHLSSKLGSDSNDDLDGSTTNDVLNGLSGNDVLKGGKGDDILNGGEGIDTAVFSENRSKYVISKEFINTNIFSPTSEKEKVIFEAFNMSQFSINNGPIRTVSDIRLNSEGVDTLSSIERIKFNDGVLLFNIPTNDITNTIYNLYHAAFGRSPDEDGFTSWIYAVQTSELHYHLSVVVERFITSAEFHSNNTNELSDRGFIELLYENTLGRPSDIGGAKEWLNALQSGSLTRADVMLAFASSDEAMTKNAANYDNGYWVY